MDVNGNGTGWMTVSQKRGCDALGLGAQIADCKSQTAAGCWMLTAGHLRTANCENPLTASDCWRLIAAPQHQSNKKMGPERIPFFYCRSLKIFQISNKLLKIPNRPSRKRQNTKKTKIKKSIPISTPPVRRFLVFPSSRTFFLIRVFCVFALRTPGDAVGPYRAETYASFTAAPAADRKLRIPHFFRASF